MNFTFNFAFFALILIFPCLPQAGKILSNTPLKLYSINQNYSTEYFLNIFIPSPIPNQAYIEIEFPFPFPLEDSSSCLTTIKSPNGLHTMYECEKLNFRYMIYIGHIISGNYEILLENIHNLLVDEISGIWVRTYENRTVLVDEMEKSENIVLLPSTSKF